MDDGGITRRPITFPTRNLIVAIADVFCVVAGFGAGWRMYKGDLGAALFMAFWATIPYALIITAMSVVRSRFDYRSVRVVVDAFSVLFWGLIAYLYAAEWLSPPDLTTAQGMEARMGFMLAPWAIVFLAVVSFLGVAGYGVVVKWRESRSQTPE